MTDTERQTAARAMIVRHDSSANHSAKWRALLKKTHTHSRRSVYWTVGTLPTIFRTEREAMERALWSVECRAALAEGRLAVSQ